MVESRVFDPCKATMHLPRVLAPALGIALLALLIGCGGSTSSTDPFTTSGGTTSTSGSTGTTGTTSLLAPAGSYTTTFASTVGSTTVTGTGTATAATNGTITLSVPAANATNSTARAVTAVVASDGTVTGSTTVGTAAAAPILSGTLAKQTNGTYLLTFAFTNASPVSETDVYTLTAAQIAYNVTGTGTDTIGGRYTDSGNATIGASSTLTLTYTSSRTLSGTTPTDNVLATTLLANGTFSGSLSIGSENNVAVTGTWSLGANNVLTLVLKYTNRNVVSGTFPNGAMVTETLTLSQ